jgi:glutaredoxin
MTNQIYTATGCVRCKITKRFMKDNGISYEEYDFKAEGKEAFSQFYRDNRKDIFRDKDGVEFPVFTDGRVIRQGLSVVVGYLIAGEALSGFIGRNRLHGELSYSGGSRRNRPLDRSGHRFQEAFLSIEGVRSQARNCRTAKVSRSPAVQCPVQTPHGGAQVHGDDGDREVKRA